MGKSLAHSFHVNRDLVPHQRSSKPAQQLYVLQSIPCLGGTWDFDQRKRAGSRLPSNRVVTAAHENHCLFSVDERLTQMYDSSHSLSPVLG